GIASALAERPHAQTQPARTGALVAGDAHFFLQTAALARGFEQAVNRFRNLRIADEYTFDRTHIVGAGRIDEIEIGSVGVEHPPALIGDEHTVESVIDQRLE